MSAFAVLYDCSGSLLEPGLLERVMGRLSHRGPDGQDAFVSGPLAMGHWHFWTTPEEVGERQPLKVDGLPFRLVFDGRLDNREDLLAALSISSEKGRLLSDAALVLRAYAAWGQACAERFIGEFALVLFDEYQHTLFCARDQMGLRSLFYIRWGSFVCIASEPWALTSLFNSSTAISEIAVAHYFALLAPIDGQTFFQDIYELLAGHSMQVSESNTHIWQYWQPDVNHKIHYKDENEYAEHFFELIQESVHCRMRAPKQAGILMSGGLDSTTIASIAARLSAPTELSTFSYVFDQYPESDERAYIHEIQRHYATRSVEILCDDLWPFANWPEWPRDKNHPAANFYFPIRQRLHHTAQKKGIRVLLLGNYGDELYSHDNDWFADLLFDGRVDIAFQEFFFHLKTPIFRKKMLQVYFRRFIRRLFDKICGGKQAWGKIVIPAWLTIEAAEMIVPAIRVGSGKFNTLFGFQVNQSSAMSTSGAISEGIELRFPFRDRRLVEYIFAIPEYQLYFRGIHRNILRNATKNVLPEKIRMRTDKSLLFPLYNFGIEQKKLEISEFLKQTVDIWSPYVQEARLIRKFQEKRYAGAEAVVPWLCVGFANWFNQRSFE